MKRSIPVVSLLLGTVLVYYPTAVWAGAATTPPNTLRADPATEGFEPEVVFNPRDEVLLDSLFPLDDVTGGIKNPLKTGQGTVLYERSSKPKPPPAVASRPLPTHFRYDREQLRYPLVQLVAMSSPFGLRLHPVTGLERFHRGVDLAAAQGTAVLATLSGRVLAAGDMGNLGNAVVLGHGTDLRTRYGHLSEIQVVVGQWVKQGDVLGAVGATGRVTGPHLHFELWQFLADTWQALDPGALLNINAATLQSEPGKAEKIGRQAPPK
ncbi:M23 family metallopeptidase [Anthocerotibacter panamensis]|uniref:M23 family metallopeptidase n=1 Tax=Anthocerotibacter panamensis TaxID=2857077 RepID=UPI001C4034F8|nr:M23 family metallopeptidase [Anthocerotibacter panamensis]